MGYPEDVPVYAIWAVSLSKKTRYTIFDGSFFSGSMSSLPVLSSELVWNL